MSWFNPFKKETTENSAMPEIKNGVTWEQLSDMLGMSGSNPSGVNVNINTAVKSSAVFACVRLIASAIASLPLKIYESGDDRAKASDHPAAEMLSLQANPLMTAITFWETVLYHLLLTGDSYNLIGRTRGGQPMSLTPLPTLKVKPAMNGTRAMYSVALESGEYVTYDQDDILHVTGLGSNGLKGLSVISASAVSIGASIAQDEYSARFFSNGARPDGVISFDKQLSPEQALLLRDYWNRVHKGTANAHVPAILTEGGTYTQISMSAQDSQLIESRQFQVVDIARIFGVPPHMIGEVSKSTSFGSGIESQFTGFVVYTLRPLVKKLEQEIQRKIIRNDNFYAEFNINGLLRGDTIARHEAYRISLGGNQMPGFLTVNEVRKLENHPPIEGGGEIYKPITADTKNES